MAVKTVAAKKRIKAWYPIYAPAFLNEVFMGESHVYAKNELEGKTLKLSLFAVTNDMKKQNMDASFKIVSVVEGKAQTRITGIYLTQSYIKRLVRRGRNKIDDSFLVKTKDRKLLRVKPLMVTNNKANKSITSRIRVTARAIIAKIASMSDHEQFFNDIISIKLQKELREKLSKIYPLRFLEIRQAVVLKDDVSIDEPVPEEPEIKAKEQDVEEEQPEEPAEEPSGESQEQLEEIEEEQI